MIGGMFPAAAIPDAVLTDDPARFRAAIIESSNPVHSLPDSPRMREAMAASRGARARRVRRRLLGAPGRAPAPRRPGRDRLLRDPHHFSGGKTQLAEEATRWAGEFIVAGAVAALAEGDPVGAIDTFRRQWTRILRRTDFTAGCVIVAATLEGDREPTVRDIAGQAFTDWEKVLADALRTRAVPAARARSLATLTIAAIEGAIVLARAQRTMRPLERVSRELEDVIADAVGVHMDSLPSPAPA